MLKTWIMIANASEAYCYSIDNKQLVKGRIDLELLNSYTHPESRKKDGDLISDRSGHYQSGTLGHGSYITPTDPKEHEAVSFAKEIADILESGRIANDYQSLILISPPHFHGLLNKHINKNVSSLIREKIEKDYTKVGKKQLTEHLKRYLIKSF